LWITFKPSDPFTPNPGPSPRWVKGYAPNGMKKENVVLTLLKEQKFSIEALSLHPPGGRAGVGVSRPKIGLHKK